MSNDNPPFYEHKSIFVFPSRPFFFLMTNECLWHWEIATVCARICFPGVKNFPLLHFSFHRKRSWERKFFISLWQNAKRIYSLGVILSTIFQKEILRILSRLIMFVGNFWIFLFSFLAPNFSFLIANWRRERESKPAKKSVFILYRIIFWQKYQIASRASESGRVWAFPRKFIHEKFRVLGHESSFFFNFKQNEKKKEFAIIEECLACSINSFNFLFVRDH